MKKITLFIVLIIGSGCASTPRYTIEQYNAKVRKEKEELQLTESEWKEKLDWEAGRRESARRVKAAEAAGRDPASTVDAYLNREPSQTSLEGARYVADHLSTPTPQPAPQNAATGRTRCDSEPMIDPATGLYRFYQVCH